MKSAAPRPGTWQLLDLTEQLPGFSLLADTLADLADEGHPIVVGTADLKYSNGLHRFERRHPGKYVQFGISEQHMVSAAAGLATLGLQPFVATFASFMALLACEQIRTDVAFTKLPVRLIGHHAGIALGFYGTSHHATEDIAIMRSIANMTVVAPADNRSLVAALRASVRYAGPIYFRIGRGRDPDVYEADIPGYAFGRAIELSSGSDLTIIATGSTLYQSLKAAATLRDEGASIGVTDFHTIKPLDLESVQALASRTSEILTVEEHNVLGGLGGAVAEAVSGLGLRCRVHRHGLQDEFSLIGPPSHLYKHYGLDAAGIASRCRAILASRAPSRST